MEERIEQLEEELKKCKKDRESLEQELKKCREEKEKLEEELKKCKADRERLEEELKKCKEVKEQLEKDLKKCKEKKKKDPCAKGSSTNVLVRIPEIKAGIYAVTGDDENVYCVGRNKNVFKVGSNKEVETIGHMDAHARAIKYDGLENIFIGTNGGTLYKYDIEEEFTEIKKVKGTITTIETDDDNNIYFGT